MKRMDKDKNLQRNLPLQLKELLSVKLKPIGEELELPNWLNRMINPELQKHALFKRNLG